MITKTPSFQTSDGTPFATLEQAQRYELRQLLGTSGDVTTQATMVDLITDNSKRVIEILRATGRKPREKKKKPGRPKGSRTKDWREQILKINQKEGQEAV